MAARERVDGSKLARLRTAKKFDQTELATRLRKRGLGTTQATVSRWENGQEPSAYALPAIAAELGVSIEDLYADADEDDESRTVTTLDDFLRQRIEHFVREVMARA